MLSAVLTAGLVGGATMLGGVTGYFIKYENPKIDGAVFSFAAGVMAAASFAELVLPAAELQSRFLFAVSAAGLLAGGGLIALLDRILNIISKKRLRFGGGEARGAWLFIAAIAIHNLPEGLAAGVALGTGDLSRALTVAAGIALQNVPEGMIVLPPLLHVGCSRKKALAVALLTGVIEMLGVALGYLTAAASGAVLPAALCTAGGTMLYVIASDLLGDALGLADKKAVGFSFLLGCLAMLLTERII